MGSKSSVFCQATWLWKCPGKQRVSRQIQGRQDIRSQVNCGKEKSVDPNIWASLRKVCVVIHNYIFFSCTLETKKYVKVRDVNTSVNEPLLAEKARYFAQQLDYENVPANRGFLDRFKGRQGKKPGYLWGRKECWPKYNNESEKSMCDYI